MTVNNIRYFQMHVKVCYCHCTLHMSVLWLSHCAHCMIMWWLYCLSHVVVVLGSAVQWWRRRQAAAQAHGYYIIYRLLHLTVSGAFGFTHVLRHTRLLALVCTCLATHTNLHDRQTILPCHCLCPWRHWFNWVRCVPPIPRVIRILLEKKKGAYGNGQAS